MPFAFQTVDFIIRKSGGEDGEMKEERKDREKRRKKIVSFVPLEPDLAKQRLPRIAISSTGWRNNEGLEYSLHCDWLF